MDRFTEGLRVRQTSDCFYFPAVARPFGTRRRRHRSEPKILDALTKHITLKHGDEPRLCVIGRALDGGGEGFLLHGR
jgi:hypothetical protein